MVLVTWLSPRKLLVAKAASCGSSKHPGTVVGLALWPEVLEFPRTPGWVTPSLRWGGDPRFFRLKKAKGVVGKKALFLALFKVIHKV